MPKEVEFTVSINKIVNIEALNIEADSAIEEVEHMDDASFFYDLDYDFVKLDKHGDLTVRVTYKKEDGYGNKL
jgi:hypothetical protein